MSDQQSIIDLDSLLSDLRLAVHYAARVGVLKNRATLQALHNADAAIAANRKPDAFALTSALNEVAALIAPMTIADLYFKRDPFLLENQRKSGLMQMMLMIFALLVLATIGDYMHSLQREQGALAALERVRELKPQEKLTELRRIAQWDEPLALPRTPRTLNEQYHQKVAELLLINKTIVNTDSSVKAALDQPMIPFRRFLLAPTYPSVALASPALAAAASTNNAMGEGQSAEEGAGALAAPVDTCAEDADGELRLPEESKHYPKWMRTALRDSLSDFCFQLTVVSPGGESQIQSEALAPLALADNIKEKISLRGVWFLPFMYGLLGSVLFVMHNVASVRTPSMGWLEIAMRISLGGVAGIIVGWFTSASSGLLPTTSLLSLPFALAFLTGYGIDILFNVLDKLHGMVTESTLRSA